MSTYGIRIDGMRETQQAILRSTLAAKPTGGLGAAVKSATLTAHRIAVIKTHVDTGALRASHLPRVHKQYGEVFINPSARRRDGERPAEYGRIEHARGGPHAFYGRVMTEGIGQLKNAAASALRRALP